MESKLKPYILLAPVAIILISIMGFGIANCVMQSLGYMPYIGAENISFRFYKEVIRDSVFLESLIFSLKTSFISSTVAVFIGVILAYFLSQEKLSKIKESLLNLPVIIPHIVVVMLMITIFSQSGIISRILYSLNIISDSSQFMSLVSDKNGVGVILVYLWKGIPFTIITAYNILKNISNNLEKVAINLGASKLQCFRYIILPLASPTIISSFIILFAFSFGSFEIGPTTPKALSVSAYTSYISSDLSQRSYAMVINVILSSLSFILLIVYNKILEKINRYKI
jgi:putative spermidine/putrescine transport system permease protein